MENYYELTIVGRTANTPTLRSTKAGVPVTNFGLWVNYDMDGEEEPARENELFQVAIFGKLAKAVVSTVKVGMFVIVTSQQMTIDREERCVELQADTVGVIPRTPHQATHSLTGEEYEVA